MSHISRKIPLTREAAKARARTLQKEARMAGRTLAYTHALAEVARKAGYANIHELTAQFADAALLWRRDAVQARDGNGQDKDPATRLISDIEVQRRDREGHSPIFESLRYDIGLRDREELLASLRNWGGLHPDILAYATEAPEKRLMSPLPGVPHGAQATPKELDVLSRLLKLRNGEQIDERAFRIAAFGCDVRNAVIDEFMSWLTSRKN